MSVPSHIPGTADGGSGCQPFSPRPHDFRGELDLDSIEMALHAISTAAVKVEILGRSAIDDIHGEKLGDVFDSVSADLDRQISLIKASLGLKKEVRS